MDLKTLTLGTQIILNNVTSASGHPLVKGGSGTLTGFFAAGEVPDPEAACAAYKVKQTDKYFEVVGRAHKADRAVITLNSGKVVVLPAKHFEFVTLSDGSSPVPVPAKPKVDVDASAVNSVAAIPPSEDVPSGDDAAFLRSIVASLRPDQKWEYERNGQQFHFMIKTVTPESVVCAYPQLQNGSTAWVNGIGLDPLVLAKSIADRKAEVIP